MIFKEIDFSSKNEELLAIIEENCAKAVNARNEIRNAERLIRKQKKESVVEKKDVSVRCNEVEVKTGDEFEDMIKCFKVDYASLQDGFDEDDLFDILPSKKSYRYRDVLLRLIAESTREINELREFSNEPDTTSDDLQEIKKLILNEQRKISLLKGLLSKKEENTDEVSEDKNSLILVPTTGGNIRVISEIENMSIEYMPLFKELFDSIINGTFKGLKGFNNNNALNGMREVRGNGVRVVFKRLTKKKYAIVTAFIKRSNKDTGYIDSLKSKVADFRLIRDKIKNNLNNQEFMAQNDLYVEELYNVLGEEEKKTQLGKKDN